MPSPYTRVRGAGPGASLPTTVLLGTRSSAHAHAELMYSRCPSLATRCACAEQPSVDFFAWFSTRARLAMVLVAPENALHDKRAKAL
jgi:hypothetical protein